jgi:hypothetical protein
MLGLLVVLVEAMMLGVCVAVLSVLARSAPMLLKYEAKGRPSYECLVKIQSAVTTSIEATTSRQLALNRRNSRALS